MKIGTVTLDNNVILAPLAGITNLPFRLLAKEAGCGMVCSEMVSSYGIVYKSQKTADLLRSTPAEKPFSAQIFGADPDIMAEAAAMVEGMGADILDINFGCAVRKIVKTGSGAALMRTADRAAALLKAVRRAVRIPLTIKIRTGWEPSAQQACNIARIAQDSGVDAIAVHPRTAMQQFNGKADWSVITAVKKEVSIPVIGNGDIFSVQDAVNMLAATGCDGIMIGRKAIGDPDFLYRVRARLNGEEEVAAEPGRRFDIMIRYLRASVEFLGEEPACRMMRSRLGWFAKHMRHCSKFRESIKHLSTEKEGVELINAYKSSFKEESL